MSGSPLAPLAILALLLALLFAGADFGDTTRPSPEPSTEVEADPEAQAAAAALERALAPVLAKATTTVEPSCPPPALLACRPAIRLSGELSEPSSPQLQQQVAVAVAAALRREGFRGLEIGVGPDRGRAHSGAEILARWRTSGDRIEVATGGLELDRPRRAAQT